MIFKRMHDYSIVLMVLVVFFLSSCSGTKYNYKNFKRLKKPQKSEYIHSKPIVGDNLGFISDFRIIDDYMVVIDDKSDKFIKIFSLKTLKFIISFGDKGQGPSEFIQPISIIESPNKKDNFFIYDLSLRQIKEFDLRKILKGDFSPERIIKIRKGAPIYLTITPEDKILAVGIFNKGRFWVCNFKGEVERIVGKIPVKFRNEAMAPQHSQGYLGKIVYIPERKEVFIATDFGAIVERYSLESEKLLNVYTGPIEFYPEYDIKQTEKYYVLVYNKKTRWGYVDIDYNKKTDEIYLLYSGIYFFNEKGIPNHGAYTNRIYVMNNRGELTNKLILDKKIWGILIYSDGFSIYGATESEILKFYKKQDESG